MKRNQPALVLSNLAREFSALRSQNLTEERRMWERRYQANLDAQRKMNEARFEEDKIPSWLH